MSEEPHASATSVKPDQRPRQLRIHGVGGSPGEALLGVSRSDDAVVVGEGLATVFLARRQDRTVEGYDWGSLTSGAPLQPLWTLLLPFTLLNVAGWMHPPFDRAGFPGQIRLLRGTVRVLGCLLTASWVVWLGVLLLDFGGYQWTRRLSGHDGVAEIKLFRWHLVSRNEVQPIQLLGVVLGLSLLCLVMWGIRRIASNTQRDFEQLKPAHWQLSEPADPGWANDESLASSGFFFHPDRAKAQLRLHEAVITAAVASVALRAAFQILREKPVLDIGLLMFWLGAAEFALVGFLLMISIPTGRTSGERPWRGMSGVAAVLAFALAHAFFSGLLLLATRRLNAWPDLPANGSRPLVTGGQELALADAWFFGVLAVIIAVLVIVPLLVWRGANTDGLAPRTSRRAAELDGLDRGAVQKVARARGLAYAAKKAPAVATVVAVLLYAIGLFVAIARLQTGGTLNPLLWRLELNHMGTIPWRAAAWFLPLVLIGIMLVIRRAATTATARRTVGILWDVLTFWPRRYHPLAVRPYSERAVLELQARVEQHVLDERRPVLMSAHSQGSILAFAALAAIDPKVLKCVALVTYGSPIQTIYAPLFPAYFGPDAVDRLRCSLLEGEASGRGWRNFYRDTDPIGGPVFLHGDLPGEDVRLLDPAEVPASEEIPEELPPLEGDRRAWVTLAGHSFYLQERDLKAWVQSVLESLSLLECPPPERRETLVDEYGPGG